MAALDLAFVDDEILNQAIAVGGGSTAVYTMRAIEDGTPYSYWTNEDAADTTGTGPNAPGGVLTDIGVVSVEFAV